MHLPSLVTTSTISAQSENAITTSELALVRKGSRSGFSAACGSMAELVTETSAKRGQFLCNLLGLSATSEIPNGNDPLMLFDVGVWKSGDLR